MPRSASPDKRTYGTGKVRFRLACDCGITQTLWVHPDAPSTTAAKANGWVWTGREWLCPECGRIE